MSQFLPRGNQIVVQLVRKRATSDDGIHGIQHRVEGTDVDIAVPETVEDASDCEGMVIAQGDGKLGYYIPTWFTDLCASYLGESAARTVQRLAVRRHPMQTKVGDRIIFDVTVATECPDSEDLVITDNDVLGIVEGTESVNLISSPHWGKFRTRG
jgi:hypothetical protein